MFSTAEIYYTIQPDDTLGSIAEKYHTTVEELQNVNSLVDLSILYVGQLIRICYASKSINDKENLKTR